MDRLEQFFKDVESIANSLEVLVKKTEPVTLNFGDTEKSKVQEVINNVATMPVVPIANGVQAQLPQMPVASVQPQVPQQMSVQTPIAVPVAQQVEGFTQEQIAKAMADATTIGRGDLVQNIFATFKVKTLMDINPANYNHIAAMLREAGIQI